MSKQNQLYLTPNQRQQLGTTTTTSSSSHSSSTYRVGTPQINVNYQQQQQQNTPFPIINQNTKSVLEKMVDFLIGDGPSSRYGMICKECHGHNGDFIYFLNISIQLLFEFMFKSNEMVFFFQLGMVSFEDYQYTAFRCAFCKALNPARKFRPVCQKLPNESGAESSTPKPISGNDNTSSSSTSTSERESGITNNIALQF